MTATSTIYETQATMRMHSMQTIEDTTRIPFVFDESENHAYRTFEQPVHCAQNTDCGRIKLCQRSTPAAMQGAHDRAPRYPAPLAVQDVFERTEKKYLVSPEQYCALMEQIRDRLGYDRFGKSLISSLYYDTESDEIVTRSLEKPLYKEKIRVRAYGDTKADSRVFVEMKKKFKGIVYKRRFACSLQAASAYMDGASYEEAIACFPLPNEQEQRDCTSAEALQIANEIDACKARHPDLRPKTMIVTNRMALITNDGSNVRITFDIDPVYRNDHLRFADGYSGKPLHRDGTLIMEIKCLGAYPLWLAHALTSTGLYPSSSTKVGHAYQLSHPTQAPRIRTDAMTWHAPEPKKNLMSRLTIMSLLNRSVEAR